MTQDDINKAVEITKAAIPHQTAHWIAYPEKVTEFIQAVAEKLSELRSKA